MLKKLHAVPVAAGAALLVLAQSSFAALPASVGTAMTGIQADGQAVFDLVFPVIMVFTGLVVTIKLVKRFSNKV